MKIIKHRALGTKGWSPTEGKGWYYGTSVFQDYNKENHFNLNRFEHMLQGNYLDKATRGMYIGLNDKDGQEMYEGDMVIDSFGRVMLIQWCEPEIIDGEIFDRSYLARFELKLIRISRKGTDNFRYAEFVHWVKPINELKVIGNIIENPEFLTLDEIDGFGRLILEK